MSRCLYLLFCIIIHCSNNIFYYVSGCCCSLWDCELQWSWSAMPGMTCFWLWRDGTIICLELFFDGCVELEYEKKSVAELFSLFSLLILFNKCAHSIFNGLDRNICYSKRMCLVSVTLKCWPTGYSSAIYSSILCYSYTDEGDLS